MIQKNPFREFPFPKPEKSLKNEQQLLCDHGRRNRQSVLAYQQIIKT